MWEQIDWTVVSVSLAVATIIFYLYFLILAYVRKKFAERDVKANQARLQRLIKVLREKRRNKEEK